jgi:hypothetical protein
MWKVQRIEDGEFVVFLLSGRIDGEHLLELQKIFASETENLNLILDMKEVKLVDQDAVRFLSSCETGGTRLRNCPPYIREWIRRRATGNGLQSTSPLDRKSEFSLKDLWVRKICGQRAPG